MHTLPPSPIPRTKAAETLGVGFIYGFTNFILLIAYAVTFRFAAYLFTLHVDHTLYANFDELFTVFMAVILGSLTAGQASTALPQATRATAAAGRLLAVVAGQEGDEEGDGPPLEELKGSVAVADVSFSFPARPAVRVLSRLSVSVAPGQSLALVGPSGAGKSTVFSLLERLYRPGSGQLTVDGVDISVSGEREEGEGCECVPPEPGAAVVAAAGGLGPPGRAPLQPQCG
jgi:ABC-type multidrug transport system fused ATPase/permease subunit